MPEPTPEDLHHWLAPEYVPDLTQQEALRAELTELGQMSELFGMEGWARLAERLERNIAADIANLETCTPEALLAVRARIGWWRYLLRLPENVAQQTAMTQTQLETFKLPDDEEAP